METNLTKGSPLELILTFSLPVFLGNLFQIFYNLIDMAIVGRFVSVQALAAVGAVGSVMFCLTGIVTGTERKRLDSAQKKEQLRQEFRDVYTVILHADKNTLLRVNSRTHAYEEFPLPEGEHWSGEIMKIILAISQQEKTDGEPPVT